MTQDVEPGVRRELSRFVQGGYGTVLTTERASIVQADDVMKAIRTI